MEIPDNALPSPEEVAKRFEKAMSAPIGAVVALYARLPETEGARIVNTDFVRLLCPEYLTDPTRYSAAIHSVAAETTRKIFNHLLGMANQLPGRGVVIFMGGGPASGKRTVLDLLYQHRKPDERPKIIYDQTLGGPDAFAQIDTVLKTPLDVGVFYVHRPVEQATLSAVLRYLEGRHGEERAIPLPYLASKHYHSQHVALALLNKSMTLPRMNVSVANNSGFQPDRVPEFLWGLDAIDFLRQPATFYANERDTYNRACRAYEAIAGLLPANAQAAFDPHGESSRIHGFPGAGHGRKLEAQPDETVSSGIISALNALRVKYAQAPSGSLLREADRLCDALPDNRLAVSKFKAAANNYVAGKIGIAEMKVKTLEYGRSIAARFKLPQMRQP